MTSKSSATSTKTLNLSSNKTRRRPAMTNPCLYCHKPVTDDIKRLPMTDGSGRVTEKLVHRACHERLMALRRKSYGEVVGL
jgi:hypothetical protein